MKIPYILLLCFIFPNVAFSQIPAPCPSTNPPLAKTCSSACILCNLDGYSATTTQTTQGQIIPGFCTQIVHSMGYMGFVAGSTDLTIQVDVGACTQGNSIEMGIFQTEDCQGFTLVSDCNTAMFTGNAYTFSNTEPLTPGCPYFLVFDNNGPAACAFTVTVLSGSATAPAVATPDVPSGPNFVCPGATVTYTIPPVFGACRYQWMAPAGTLINGMPAPVTLEHDAGTTVTVTWGNQGGQICVRGLNPCSQGPSACLPVTVGQIPPTMLPPITLCSGQFIEWIDGNLYSTSKLLSTTYTTSIGCDSTVQQQLIVLSPIVKNLGVQRLCSGDCLTVGNNQYCSPGFFQEILTAANGCDSTVSFTIQVITATAVIALPDTLSCLQDSIWLDGSGSSAGSQFAWLSNGAALSNDDSLLVHQPGIYQLLIARTVSGLTCRDTAEVSVPGDFQLPSLIAAGDTITCTDTLAQIFASSPAPGVAYAWNGPAGFQSNAPSPVVSVPGVYTIQVLAPNGCARFDSVAVVDNAEIPVLEWSLSDTLDCQVDSVLLNIQSNSAGTAFVWSGPQNFTAAIPNIAVHYSGTYSVAATAPNGCTAALSVFVPADTLPPVAVAAGDTLTCLQPTGNISAVLTPSAAAVAWSGPQNFSSNQIDPPVNLSGTYQLIATASNGCTTLASATVLADTLPPNLSVSGATLTCSQNPVSLAASIAPAGTVIAWTGPQNFTSNQLQPPVSTPGSYTAVATAYNGCTSSATALVPADTLPPQVSALGDTLTCIHLTGTLGLSLVPAGSSAAWTGPQNFSSTLPQPPVAQPGIYTVTATAPNGCTATAEVSVIADASIPQVSAGGGTITCSQNTVTLTATLSPAGSTIAWTGPLGFSSNQTTPVASLPGLYTILATTANGCTASATAQVLADTAAPALALVGSTISCLQSAVTIQAIFQPGAATVAWTGPQNFSSSLANPLTAIPGTYMAVATLPNGCSASASLQVPVDTIAPQITASAGRLTCSQTTAGLSAATVPGTGITLLWSGPQNFSSNLANPATSIPGTYTVVATLANGCSRVATTAVLMDTLPPVVTASGGAITCNQEVVQLGTALSPADATVFWTGPPGFSSTLLQPDVSAGGLYSVLATAPNGCTAIASAEVLTDTAAPVVMVSGGMLTCVQNTLILNAAVQPASAGTWWTGPQNFTSSALQPSISIPGQYILTATGPNGCTAHAEAVVTADSDFPQVQAAGGSLTCLQVALTLSASVSLPNANLSWTGPQNFSSNLLNPVAQVPGTYTLTATTPAGCSATATATVQTDTLAPQVTVGNGVISCLQPGTTLMASTLPVGCQVAWQGPQNFSSAILMPTVTQPGNYTIVATGPNGCSATGIVQIAADTLVPQITATAGGVITCAQSAVPLQLQLAPGNVAVHWYGPQNFNSTAQSPLVSIPGNYSVTATGANGCTAVATVPVNADLLYPQVSAGSETITCARPLVPLAAQVIPPGGVFQWAGPQNFHSTQPGPAVSVPGLYALTVTLPNGCSATAFVAVAADLAAPLLDVFGNAITCREDSAQLEAIVFPANSSIQWTGPNNFSSPLAAPVTTIPGHYTAVATGSNGCTTTAQITVAALNQPAWTSAWAPRSRWRNSRRFSLIHSPTCLRQHGRPYPGIFPKR
ncbi:MAG: hypothetical protein IPM81_00695 [Saprospirales bacterium]|nr:hypothetical protein [Saprospirales bacterium]